MIETYTRPFLPDERAEISRLIDDVPNPWRSAGQHTLIILAAILIVFAMGLAVWGIMSTNWSEMVMGSVAALPASIGLLALLVLTYILVNAPRVFWEEQRLRDEVLAEQPPRQALLEGDVATITRVEAVDVLEIVLDEDSDYIYLFELADGTTFYYESEMTELGEWPSSIFEIARGLDGEDVVWERTRATGALLIASQYIDEPWCYDGFERLIHRDSGDDAFTEGVYNEAPEVVLHRLLGNKVVDTSVE